jgi:hypothetical protein
VIAAASCIEPIMSARRVEFRNGTNAIASSDGRSPLPQESVQKKLFYADQCERDVLNRGLGKYQPD